MSSNESSSDDAPSVSKKRKNNPDTWKVNQRKIARQQGRSYVTKSGKQVQEKTVGNPCK